MPAETDVLQFCAAVFKSVWALELLLTLRKCPELGWQATDLIKELRCSSGVAAESLHNLTAAGLVIEPQESGLAANRPRSMRAAGSAAFIPVFDALRPFLNHLPRQVPDLRMVV